MRRDRGLEEQIALLGNTKEPRLADLCCVCQDLAQGSALTAIMQLLLKIYLELFFETGSIFPRKKGNETCTVISWVETNVIHFFKTLCLGSNQCYIS